MELNDFFQHYHLIADDPNAIARMREMILDLAVRGKLVPQDENDEPASELLERIKAEKQKLITEKKIKKQKALPEVAVDDIQYDLPRLWKWVRLQDITSKITDGDHKTPPRIDTGKRLLSAKNIRDGYIEYSNCDHISEEHYKKSRDRCCPEVGDLLIVSVGGTIGRTSLVEYDSDFALVRSVALIKPLHIEPGYLRYAMESSLLQKVIEERKRGGAQPCLYLSEISKFIFPLPPLEEQKRIVAKVDQLMGLCDELEAQREKQQRQYEALRRSALYHFSQSPGPTTLDDLFHPEVPIPPADLRKSILDLAVRGQLVPQNPNDGNAEDLLNGLPFSRKDKVTLSEEERPYILPHQWQWCHLGDLAELITSGSRGWAKYYSDSGPIFVTMGNLARGDYRLRLDKIRHVRPPKSSEGKRTQLQQDDILISVTGDVGNLGLIPPDFGEAYINQHTCLLRLHPILRNKYIPEYLRSNLAKKQFNEPQRGIKNSFRLTDVSGIIVPLPPLAEQKRIVARVNELMALCDALESQLSAQQSQRSTLLKTMTRELM